MFWNVLRVFLVLVLLSVTALVPDPVYGCSCGGRRSVEREFEGSSAVFTGQVVGMYDAKSGTPLSRWDRLFQDFSDRVIEIEVNEAWRGVEKRNILLASYPYSNNCSLFFSMREEYLIYGYQGADGIYNTDICTRTTTIREASSDLDYLRTQPTLLLPPVSNSLSVGLRMLLLGGILMIVGISGVVWFWGPEEQGGD